MDPQKNHTAVINSKTYFSIGASEPLWDWDLLNGRTVLNEHFYTFFGYKVNSLQLWTDGIFPDDRGRVFTEMQDCVSKKETSWTTEFRYLKANYTIIDIYSRSQLFYDEKGNLSRMTGAMVDLSEKKTVERELEKRNKQLREISAYLQEQREKEKQAIAYEMHEQLGQEFAAVHMTLRSMMDEASSANPPLYKKLEEVCNNVKNSIQKIRRLSFELYPGILKDIGLAEAIDSYMKKFSQETSISTFFICEEDEIVLSSERQLVLFRAFQQGLDHTLAQEATEVVCAIRMENENLVLTICDNGKNFLKAEERQSSIELLSVKERLAGVDGTISVEVDWKEGTVFTVTLPSS